MTAEVVSIASWNVDLIAHVPGPPAVGQTVLASHFERLPGGKGSNAAVAAARQGAQVALVARIGGDDFGAMGLALWAQEGIDSRHVERDAQRPNGTALIWVYPDGNNSIAVYPGASAALGPEQVLRARPLISGARVVMASCEVPLAATQEAFRIARSRAVRTLLNPAPAMHLPDSLWPMVDVLTPNEDELRALSGCDDADAGAQVLLARGVGAVVVTLGARGCRLYRPGQTPLSQAGHAVQVIDTIGAGDAFNGALAAAFARGLGWPQALNCANAAAALSTTAAGAVAGLPTLLQVRHGLAGPEAPAD